MEVCRQGVRHLVLHRLTHTKTPYLHKNRLFFCTDLSGGSLPCHNEHISLDSPGEKRVIGQKIGLHAQDRRIRK